MMLFEAMPLSLRSDKRKSTCSHEDLPLSKKIALDSKPVTKYRQSKSGQMSFAEKTSSPSLKQIPPPSSSSGSHSRTVDLNLALRMCSDDDDGDVWSAHGLGVKLENGVSNKHVSGNGRVTQSHQVSKNRGDSDTVGYTSMESPAFRDELPGVSGYQTINSGDASSHSMKQSSLFLKKSGENQQSNQDEILAKSLYEGGYMRRMASLNASACVTALMEPEKRTKPHKNMLSTPRTITSTGTHISQRARKLWSNDDQSPGVSPVMRSKSFKDLSLSPTRFSSSPSEADTSKDSDEILCVTDPKVYTLLALASLARSSSVDSDEIPFNKLGLLYNGDTIHPAVRVFYTSDTDLTLPDRIIPRIIPSDDGFVGPAISDALAHRSMGKKKKGAKANNGWKPLGNPIKTIDYANGSNFITRRYYAGIRRNNAKEVIFIRDSILIRAGGTSEKDDKPYVAKIASIWQEQPGQLMMTVFWYYRPYELDGVATQGIAFQKDELLASQHNDDNSVACIEEKCYVLGTTQYCRYQAYIQSRKEHTISRQCQVVPPHATPSSNESESLQTDIQQNSREVYGPSWSSGIPELTRPCFKVSKPVEPDLVYLCQRGYNHCAAKLTSKSSREK